MGVCFSQRNEDVKRLVNEGIQLHDKGEYEEAVKKYDEALKINAEDFDANYEKSFTYLAAKNYEACIAMCSKLVEKFSSNPTVKQVYTNWGSALDDNGKQEEAIKVFNKGLEKFPDYYPLYFNKGLTYMRGKKI